MKIIDQLQVFAAPILKADEAGIPNAGKSADSILTSGLDLLYFFIGVAAVVTIIFSSITYTTSNGDPSKIKEGKDGILYGVVGLVFVMMAFTITGFIIGRFR